MIPMKSVTLWRIPLNLGLISLCTFYICLCFAGTNSKDNSTIFRYSKFEIAVNVDGNWKNPFDFDEISIQGHFRTQVTKKTYVIDGFYFQDYNRNWDNGEKLTPNVNGKNISQQGSFNVVKGSQDQGFLQVSATNKRFFEFWNGDPYFAIGENIVGQVTYDYDKWFGKLAQNGGSYTRIWLDGLINQNPLVIESKNTGVGSYSLIAAWRLDYILNLATSYGIRFQFCIESYNSFRITNFYEAWEDSPYNSRNGGKLDYPPAFFTSEWAISLFQRKLRYINARYGFSTNILSWELFNEVDITQGYVSSNVRAWHQRMGRFLNSIDPYKHMVTTSFSDSIGDFAIDSLSEISYVQTHHYDASDFGQSLPQWNYLKTNLYDKPHTAGEMGLDNAPQDDPKGIYLHNSVWATTVTMHAGCADTWYWDNYVDPCNLYYIFKPIQIFTKNIPFNRLTWKSALTSISSFQTPQQASYVRVLGMIGTESEVSTGLLWIQNTNHSWYLANQGVPSITLTNIQLNVTNLMNGDCTIQWFDTVSGKIISKLDAVIVNQTISLQVPAFNLDIALQILPRPKNLNLFEYFHTRNN